MVNEIKFTKLGDIAQIKGGKRLPNGSSLQQVANSHPYIRVRDLNNVIILEKTTDFEYVDDETQKQIARYIVDEGDIVLSIVGTIGLLAIVGKTLHKANLTENCVRITNIDKNYSKLFLYYFLHSQYGQNEIKKGIVGAVQAKLPLKNIATISVPILPLRIQQKIGRILSSIDDKIRLNTQINQNLEAQAQAIFKSWFVDFEPFQDNKFVDSELGQIPEGWYTGTLGEIASVTSGKRPSQRADNKSEDNKYPLVGASCIMGFTNNFLYETPIIVTGRVGTHGIIQFFNQKCWPSDNTLVIQSPYIEFVYHYLHTIDFHSLNRGSTQPLITQTDIKQQQCLIPITDILIKYETILSCNRMLIQQNNLENQKLSFLRDTLLPKLMSGEIDVSVIEI